MRACAILAAIAALIPTAAHATRWVRIADTPDATRYIDTDAIVFEDSTATIWLRTEYVRQGQKGEKSAIEKWMHDCATNRSKLLAMTLYKPDGRVIGSAEVPRYLMDWLPVVSGSAGETVHTRICSLVNGPVEERDPDRITFSTA